MLATSHQSIKTALFTAGAMAAPGAIGSAGCGVSGIEISAGQNSSGTGTDKGSRSMVSVGQCITNGIASDASSTTIHAVMWTCGLRTRNRFRPNQTTPPSTKERSAASARVAIILFHSPRLLCLGHLVGQRAQLLLV